MSVISDIYDAKMKVKEKRRFGNIPTRVYLGVNLLHELISNKTLCDNETIRCDSDAGRHKVFGMNIYPIDEIGHVHIC